MKRGPYKVKSMSANRHGVEGPRLVVGHAGGAFFESPFVAEIVAIIANTAYAAGAAQQAAKNGAKKK